MLELELNIIYLTSRMGTLSWVVKSEFHPLRYKGNSGSLVANSNWVSNSILAQTFFNMNVIISTFISFLVVEAILVKVLCNYCYAWNKGYFTWGNWRDISTERIILALSFERRITWNFIQIKNPTRQWYLTVALWQKNLAIYIWSNLMYRDIIS